MQKILAATDLSVRGDRALARAAALAVQHGCALRLLHVVDRALPSQLAERQIAAARETMGRGPEGLDPARVVVEARVGDPFVEVLLDAVAWGAEVIVLGAHGRDGKGFFKGTTAERIIRHGHVPVLVAKGDPLRPFERILVGFDFSVHALRAVQMAIRLAPEADMRLVHAFAPPPELMFGAGSGDRTREAHVQAMNRMIDNELQAYLARFGDKAKAFRREVRQGDPGDVLLEAAARHDADLVVLGTHGRTGMGHALLGSVAERLIDEATVDVLVARAW